MGQQYLAAAILNHFEGLHVQSFDLPTLLSHSDRVCLKLLHMYDPKLIVIDSPLRRQSFNCSPRSGGTDQV
jgi:hypothetical protein